jgi:hypothetical protein
VVTVFLRERMDQRGVVARQPVAPSKTKGEPEVISAASEEIRILAGSGRNYVDHSGKVWSPDSYFSGGTPVKSPWNGYGARRIPASTAPAGRETSVITSR